LKIIAKGPMTRLCSPGDIIQVTGVYMPAPSGKTNFRDKRARLTHRTFIEAYQIVKDKLNFKEF
jgi:DNA replication licensing factor MCM7